MYDNGGIRQNIIKGKIILKNQRKCICQGSCVKLSNGSLRNIKCLMNALFSAAWKEVRKPRRDGKVPRDYGQWGVFAISGSSMGREWDNWACTLRIFTFRPVKGRTDPCSTHRTGKGKWHEDPQGARALRECCLTCAVAFCAGYKGF